MRKGPLKKSGGISQVGVNAECRRFLSLLQLVEQSWIKTVMLAHPPRCLLLKGERRFEWVVDVQVSQVFLLEY